MLDYAAKFTKQNTIEATILQIDRIWGITVNRLVYKKYLFFYCIVRLTPPYTLPSNLNN